MGTRLLTEQWIRREYPQLKYVRAHTTGRNAATLYAWNENLELPATDAAELKKFAAGCLSSSICYRVKAYSMLQEDQVPKDYELPEPVAQAAIDRELEPGGVLAVMNGILEPGVVTFNRYDYISGTLHFQLFADPSVTDIEMELAQRYLSEMIPLGTRCELKYGLEN